LDEVRNVDPEIAQAIVDEQNRQNSHIELIASENWVSKAVMAAMGSPLTNKYAEGYPGKRYYGGCECVDVVEDLAQQNDLLSLEPGQRYENRIRYYTQGERKKRNHRLITRGGAVESIAPEVRGMSERAFFLLMEKVFSLPEVAALVSHATDQQEGG